jgi:hypothetical protein
MMRRFTLVREEDVSGVSGTGVVAEGVLLSNNKVVLSWCSPYHSVTVFDTIEDLEAIHGHEGRTWIEWLDAQSSESRPVALARSLLRPLGNLLGSDRRDEQ